ncbi:anaphase-promoting complex subunit 1 [Senna tora]|uniref:Anaphase-promoting complex subunit 1 n=1 Tax=Senna tora TaxID=362788 RepID=A0A834TS74_9FABA|nr:anaphase-promoting complex subunit 1 [Senna tora]
MNLVTFPLTRNNFMAWGTTIKTTLEANGKLGDGSVEIMIRMNLCIGEKANLMAKSWITNSISKELQEQLIFCPSTKILWQELEESKLSSGVLLEEQSEQGNISNRPTMRQVCWSCLGHTSEALLCILQIDCLTIYNTSEALCSARVYTLFWLCRHHRNWRRQTSSTGPPPSDIVTGGLAVGWCHGFPPSTLLQPLWLSSLCFTLRGHAASEECGGQGLRSSSAVVQFRPRRLSVNGGRNWFGGSVALLCDALAASSGQFRRPSASVRGGLRATVIIGLVCGVAGLSKAFWEDHKGVRDGERRKNIQAEHGARTKEQGNSTTFTKVLRIFLDDGGTRRVQWVLRRHEEDKDSKKSIAARPLTVARQVKNDGRLVCWVPRVQNQGQQDTSLEFKLRRLRWLR